MKVIKKSTGLAVGSMCALSFAAYSPVQAAETPFRMAALPYGYMLADASEAAAKPEAPKNTGAERVALEEGAAPGSSEQRAATAPPKAESKFPEGWCGDGGRCGYKRR